MVTMANNKQTSNEVLVNTINKHIKNTNDTNKKIALINFMDELIESRYIQSPKNKQIIKIYIDFYLTSEIKAYCSKFKVFNWDLLKQEDRMTLSDIVFDYTNVEYI